VDLSGAARTVKLVSASVAEKRALAVGA
jgi:hypothetical protein